MEEKEAVGLRIGADDDALESFGTEFVFVVPPLFAWLLKIGDAEQGKKDTVVGFFIVDEFMGGGDAVLDVRCGHNVHDFNGTLEAEPPVLGREKGGGEPVAGHGDGSLPGAFN